MSVGKVWLFVFGALTLVAAAVSSKHDAVIESRTKGKANRRWLMGGAPAPPVPPFFAGNRRPEGLPDISGGEEILQTEPPTGSTYFVSLFDRVENTPFYSAYKVTPTQAAAFGTAKREQLGPNPTWKDPPSVPGLNQAYEEAMKKKKPETNRGHMNPSGINTFDLNFMNATFTLTNAVPQSVLSNGDDWARFENRIKTYARTCGAPPRGGTLYLLTGKSKYDLDGTFGNLWEYKSKGGVQLVAPLAVWTAGCCVWAEPGKVFKGLWTAKRAESFAIMSNNQKKKGEIKPRQVEMSVSELEEKLAELGSVNLFPGNLNCRANDIKLP